MKKYKYIILNITISLGIGALSALLTMNSMDLYKKINTPKITPSSIVFPIVWTILYILMGVSYYLLKSPRKKEKIVYFIQLGVNALWSIFFFVCKLYLFSFVWIILLDVLVIFMILIFYKNNKVSAYLQIPYLIWILFASYLNLGIYILN